MRIQIRTEMSAYQIVGQVLEASLMYSDKEEPEKVNQLVLESRGILYGLSALFEQHHNAFTDKQFMVIKRFLATLELFNDGEETSDEFMERCRKLNYSSLDSFDDLGNKLGD